MITFPISMLQRRGFVPEPSPSPSPSPSPYASVNSLELDGTNQYVKYGTDSSLQFVNIDFSGMIWLKYVDESKFEYLMGNDINALGWGFVKNNANRMALYIGNELKQTVALEGTANVWNLLGFARNKTSGFVTFYLNGAVAGTGTHTNALAAPAHEFVMGIDPTDFLGVNYTGKLCEASVYDKELTLANFQEAFSGGCPGDPKLYSFSGNLIEHWRVGGDPLDNATGGSGNIQAQVNPIANNGTPIATVAGDITSDNPCLFVDTAALKLNGTDQGVDFGNHASLALIGTDLSISMWIDAVSMTGTRFLIGNDINTPNGGWGFFTDLGNRLGFYIQNEFKWGSAVLSAGSYFHVAVTYNWTTRVLIFYVDGVAAGGGTFTKDIDTSAHKVWLGIDPRTDPGVLYHWDGNNDDVGVYNLVLSPAAIANIATGPKDETGRAGIVSQWNFENDLLDAVGSNNGIGFGSPTFDGNVPA